MVVRQDVAGAVDDHTGPGLADVAGAYFQRHHGWQYPAAMSAIDPGSRLTAGVTGASGTRDRSRPRGQRFAGEHPDHGAEPRRPPAPSPTAPMNAHGRSRRSNSACRRVNRSAGTGDRAGRSVVPAGGPSLAPGLGDRARVPRWLGLVSRRVRAGGRPRLSPVPTGRPKASSQEFRNGGAPSDTGARRRPDRGPKDPRPRRVGRRRRPAAESTAVSRAVGGRAWVVPGARIAVGSPLRLGPSISYGGLTRVPGCSCPAVPLGMAR